MDAPRLQKCLPMQRCPGCRCVLEFPVQIPFRHPSMNWRAAVADLFPVCLECSWRMEDPFRQKCEEIAAEWWNIDRELQSLREESSTVGETA